MTYRNPNIIPYVYEADRENYYAFKFIAKDIGHMRYCLVNRSRYEDDYAYDFYTRSEFFYYQSYLNIFENLYLTFYSYDNDTDPPGAYHEYLILSPSVTLKIEKDWSYM